MTPVEASTAVQSDTLLLDDERYERGYRCRKAALQQRLDVANDRLFLLGDGKPWQVFGQSSRLDRRRLVFERSQGFPALHDACVAGNRERVRTLLSSPGACVLERDSCGRVALHHAVVAGNLRIAKRLLRRRDARLQVHVKDNSSRTALHYALEKMEVLALHRQGGRSVPALVTAEMRDESQRYRRLWELADQMLEMFSRSALEGGRPMDGESRESLKELDLRCRGDAWDVCRSGDLRRLETIIKVYGCSDGEWELEELGRTLLHEACENQQLGVVDFLLATMRVSAFAQDTSGCTALHCAARRGSLDVCQMLLGESPSDRRDEGFQLDETAEELALLQDVRGRTALHWCLLGSCDPLERVKAATCLVQSCPAALHVCDHDGISPLHLAIWRGEVELVQQFIVLGASVCGSIGSVSPEREDEKAPWAPCGIVFQRRRQQKETLADASVAKERSACLSPSCSKRHAPDWESVQHPVEALWYWTQHAGRPTSKDKAVDIKSEEERGSEPLVTEEELGCRKYGGTCARCKLTDAGGSTRLKAPVSSDDQCRPLSPLLLALRVCTLKWGSGSKMDHRAAIVHLLLSNGAPPDDDATNTDEQAKAQSLSALSEGIRASLRYPQMLSMLLKHGARQINPRDIVRWSSWVSSTNVEAVLSQLLFLENVATSTEFLVILFHNKHFFTLRELVQVWLQRPQSANEIAGEVTALNYDFSPWKRIHESLKSWSKRRNAAGDARSIDIEHLEFLRGLIQPVEDNTAPNSRDISSIFDLLECCVDLYLQHRVQERKVTRESAEQHERVILDCIRILFRHWKKLERDDQRTVAKAAAWLEPVAALGYFDCALVLLETLHRMHYDGTLLDMVFELYASAVAARRSFELRHPGEFLFVCVEKLLHVDSNAVGNEQQQQSSLGSSAIATFRSFVHSCANNFPIAIVKRCFAVVFPDGVMCVSANTLAALTKLRVGGKTVYEWIVLHTRTDLMSWLVTSRTEGRGRGSCWKRLVAASAVPFSRSNDVETRNSCSFVEHLFELYADHVQNHLSASERRDLLVDLMVKCAIPTDSVALLSRLVECSWGSNDKANGEPVDLTVALKGAHIPHLIARWNAVKIAAFCLSGQPLSDGSGINRVDWKQLLVDGLQERHELDECTPLELCRLLGHNSLYRILSSSLQNERLPVAKTVVETESGDSEECESSDNNDTEHESTEHWQIGLLHSVLEINESLMAKSAELGCPVENLRGYQRHVSVQSPWIAAVTLSQVSLLQAMALTQWSCSDLTPSVCALVLAAIKSCSLGAFKWILDSHAPVAKHLSDQEGVECLNAAAKHPGDVYAEMTLLLLENQLRPGRLSGDGMGVPLLHRAACFSKTSLACRILAILLERSDCDVNALDAFGNTAVSYALAAGCLSNACFLMQHSKCRLEAEYEGQASFYYVLHILPSFAARAIVRELLVTKRGRAFLHCEAEDKSCGCKGYESTRDEAESDGALSGRCSFCGHEAVSHRVVPLPSWFRDQYDTYIATRNSPGKRSRSSSDEDDDSDGDTSPAVRDDESSEDEETVLENARGRLDVQLLRRITALRYDDMLHANGLSLADASEQPELAVLSVDDNPVPTRSDPLSGDGCGPATQNEPELETSECVTTQELAPVDGVAPGQRVALNGERIGASRTKLSHCPWWLQQELAMVHSPRCRCQAPALVTRPTQLVHVAVCRWLRRLASGQIRQHAAGNEALRSFCSDGVTETAIVALASMQTAFECWRRAARLTDSPPTGAVPKPPAPLLSVLSSVLFHWRQGKTFLAFQRWKNHQKSAEVAHHGLATRLEQVAAEMRRHRFRTLQVRQQQLQDATRSLQFR